MKDDIAIKTTNITFVINKRKYNITWDGTQYVLTEFIPSKKKDGTVGMREEKAYFNWIASLLRHMATIIPATYKSETIAEYQESIKKSCSSIATLMAHIERTFPTIMREIGERHERK